MTRLALRFLGQFSVELGNRPVTRWRYDKIRALLVYLALESDRAPSRDELAGLLWPESSNAAARKSLRQALAILRAVLEEEIGPPVLHITREAIRFVPAGDTTVDVHTFSAHLHAVEIHAHDRLETCPSCVPHLAAATACYRGDLLPGLQLGDAVPFEEWLLVTRERLRLEAIEALGRLAAACEALARDDDALRAARQQLALDPWNEEAVRLLMRVLARRGQRPTALAEYERFRRVLAGELSIEPALETTALLERIRGGELGLAPRPAGDWPSPVAPLPVPLTPFIGREQEVAVAAEQLRENGPRLLTFLGPPGVGKTRMMVQVAQVVSTTWPERVFFVPLDMVADASLLPHTMMQALGLGETGYRATWESVVQALRNQRTLLLLDNFEHLLIAAPWVEKLLQQCPELTILVTSRAPLRIRGEHHVTVPPLTVPDRSQSPELASLRLNPAVRLFVGCAQAVVASFKLTPDNADAVAALCDRLDGLPLAIELAAARVRLLSPRQLLQRLDETPAARLSLLEDSAGSLASQRHTLGKAIQWSYQLLEPEEQQLFVRLSVFVDGFTVEAAESICRIDGDGPPILNGISGLLDNSLLQRDEKPDGTVRFFMLFTVREHVQDVLARSDELDPLRERHAAYFLGLARAAEPEISRRQHAVWLERLEQETGNMRAALSWAVEHAPEQALDLAVALFPFWHMRAQLSEGLRWLEQALAVSDAPTATRARGLAAAGLLAQRLGDYRHAEALTEASVALSRRLEHPQALAYALNNQSIVRMSLGDNRGAHELATQSLELSQASGNQPGAHRALMILGQVALHEDRLGEARAALQASLDYWRSYGDLKSSILCLVNLARARMLAGEYRPAVALAEEADTLSRQTGDRQWNLMAAWTLSEIALREGRLREAREQFNVCLNRARELGDRYFETLTLSQLGLLAIREDRTGDAQRLLEVGLGLAQEMGSGWCIADIQGNLGLAFLCQGDLNPAATWLRASLNGFQALGDRAQAIVALERLARLALAEDQCRLSALILAAASAERAALGTPLPPGEVPEIAGLQLAIQARLGEPLFTTAWAEGAAMSLSAVAAAIDALEKSSGYSA